MEESVNKEQVHKHFTGLITFPVPAALSGIKEDISIIINTPSKFSKEEIINQAIKLHLQGNISEAVESYEYCLKKGFNDPRVLSNYGLILKSLDKLQESKILFLKAIELKPDFAMAYSNLGTIFRSLGELKKAEVSIRRAIELKPDLAVAHYNMGIILRELDKLKEAEISTQKAIELKPDYVDAYFNLGSILNDLGKLKKAEISIRKAIELKPDFAEAYFSLANLELLKGNYKSGLENYEFRLKKKKSTIINSKIKIGKIDSKELEKRQKLLVIYEQGLGDTLQYMRYIPYLRNQGFDISFCAQPKLHSLIKASRIDSDPLTFEQSEMVSEGQWISLLSLPRHLQINPRNPIVTAPYIYSTDKLVKKWRNILSKEKRPIVGINWQGNRNMEKDYRGRSIPLEMFSKIFYNNDMKIISLQKGFGSEQLEHCSFKNKFIKCQSEIDSIWDFLENAAIIENCDLIITCDTSIAHLAGGMGKKVWLLLKDIPYWTWGLGREDTFWYPNMRLFRQIERNNWPEVMARVSKEIKKEIGRGI